MRKLKEETKRTIIIDMIIMVSAILVISSLWLVIKPSGLIELAIVVLLTSTVGIITPDLLFWIKYRSKY